MKKDKTPAQELVGTTRAFELAMQIERIRKADPRRYARIMRKYEELRVRDRK